MVLITFTRREAPTVMIGLRKHHMANFYWKTFYIWWFFTTEMNAFFILLTTDPMPCIAMTDSMIDPMTNLMADTMNSPIQGKFNVCSAYYWLWISQVWWWDWGRGAMKTTVYISRHINYEKLHPTFGHTFFKKRSLLEIFYRPMFPERGNFFAGGVEYV